MSLSGLETSSNSAEKRDATPPRSIFDTTSRSGDELLDELLASWPGLTDDTKEAVVAIIRGAFQRKESVQ